MAETEYTYNYILITVIVPYVFVFDLLWVIVEFLWYSNATFGIL